MVFSALISDEKLRSRLAQISVLAMDVDGVLTDGGIYIGSDEVELKRFHVADGLGLTALRALDIGLAWISGRQSLAVLKRAGELQIPYLFQGVGNKAQVLGQWMQERSLSPDAVAYIGDDWNDLLAFEVVGVRIAVADAASEVKNAADYVTTRPGGGGAVREVCEALMDVREARAECLAAYLQGLQSVTPISFSTQ